MSTVSVAGTVDDLLPDDLLARLRERAPRFDAENAFFAEDLDELRAAGYLAAPVPVSMGGSGLSLSELVSAQRRLAAAAPATALGINMHLVWVQVARFLHERSERPDIVPGAASGVDQGGGPAGGSTQGAREQDAETERRGRNLGWVLRDAAAGEIFAFGISEAGNEAVLLDSQSVATPHSEGGYAVDGTKIFTTLSPVWTRLGVHARCGDDLVFGFVRREEAGVRGRDAGGEGLAEGAISHPGIWNPLGMRATQSYTTRLEGVRIAEHDVAARLAPFDAADPLILAIFSSFSILTAAVYAGIADRALELAAEAAARHAPVIGGAPGETAPRLDDPDVAARLTTAVLEHRTSLDSLELLARDVDEQRTRADWFLALAAARNLVTDEARRAVDVAMRLSGAGGFEADSELARLYRDVLAGLFHPSSSRALARSVRATLGE